MRRFVSGLCLTLMFVAVSLAQTAWWLSHAMSDTATFRDAVRAVPRVVDAIESVPLLVGAALVLMAVAVLVARDRPRTLRRAGYVLVASTAFTLVTRFVVAAVLVPLLPAGLARAVGGAVTAFMLGALLPALVVTAVAGLCLVGAGFAWGRARSRPRVRAAAPGAPPPYAYPGPVPQPLPVGGPPVANVDVVSPAAAIPAVLPPTAPAAAPPTAPMPSDAAETVEDPGGWGPLRY